MDRDATFLLSLLVLAGAALVVGVSGWYLFVRDHRAWKRVHPHGGAPTSQDHPAEAS